MMATKRQIDTFEKVVNEHKPIPKAMLEAGYSKSFSNNPQELTRSDAWKELLDKHIPDELLTQKHRELLDARDKEGNIDVTAVRSGVDMGYKLKGKYAPEQSNVNILNVTIDAKTKEIADRYEDELKKTLEQHD